ncbi:hypothetical protein [Actinomadura sp. 21ATH]|uniref:hypothetical protein n=1 Tax=Actinomadura sp. 21ATH TaxID=1735444 RepID=UPI0035C262CD
MTGIAVLGTFAAGCGSSAAGGHATGASTSPSRPATVTPVTEAQAKTIFARYQKVNNQANAQVSDELLRSNETGPMLEADLAGNKRIRGKHEKKISAFFYRNPQFYIPRTSAPAWFAVTAAETESGNTELLVFVDTGGGSYKAAVGVWLAKGKKFPAIARNSDGSATAVTAGDALGAGGKISDYLTTAAAGKQPAAGLAPGPLTSKLGKNWAKAVKRTNGGLRWAGGTSWKVRPQPVYALKTADGGALVASVSIQTLTYTAIRQNVWYQPDSAFFGLGPKRYYNRFSGERLWEFATHVPPSGQADVVASASHATSATGS